MIKDVSISKVQNRLSYGMVGGGSGSFIGEVHRIAARINGNIDLKSAAFSRNFENSLKTGEALGLEKNRIYKDYKEMAEKESLREDKIDFVTIVTPNNMHYPVAKTFLEKGINVVCEKPFVFEVEEAEELINLATENDLTLAVTYTYSGYPMVKEAKELIRNGEIGQIRFVYGEYSQDWLASRIENSNKQASWRVDPKQAGRSNVVGDIGSHIENTVSYITGLKIQSVCANLDTFVEGRNLDDNAEILVKFENGARGIFWCSQIAIGHDNDLQIKVFGDKGSIEWKQEDPNVLKLTKLNGSTQLISRGRTELHPIPNSYSRLPAGHPEGYLEAMSNIYSSVYKEILQKRTAKNTKKENYDYPTGIDGLNGVIFINKCVESSLNGASWIKF